MASKHELERTVPYQACASYYNGGSLYRDRDSLFAPGLTEEIRIMQGKAARFWDSQAVPEVNDLKSYLEFIRVWVPPEYIGERTTQLQWDTGISNN